MSALRIVFFGTPDIAVPTLERLLAGPHEVVGVVSQPDRARGRGRKLSPSPVSAVANREKIPLLRPEKIGQAECIEELAAWRPDLGVVVAFGQFLPKKVRELPTCGYLINAHASLLPSYRGAAPIARAILDGQPETGISVMRIEKEMDAGPVASVVRTPIAPRENTAELSARLAELAADAIAEAVETIARGDVEWTEQDASAVTYAEKITKSDAVLDLRESARAVACRIHALSPKPGGSLTLLSAARGGSSGGAEGDAGVRDEERGAKAEEAGTPIKIGRADVQAFDAGAATESAARPEPGTIERDAGGVALRIATKDGWLVPLVVQRAGGKALPVEDFLRGFEFPADARCAVVGREGTVAR